MMNIGGVMRKENRSIVFSLFLMLFIIIEISTETKAAFFTNFDINDTLLLYYAFEENFSTTRVFLDYSGNGQNLTLTPTSTNTNLTWVNQTNFAVNNTNGSAFVSSNTFYSANESDRVSTKWTDFNGLTNFTYCFWANFSGNINYFSGDPQFGRLYAINPLRQTLVIGLDLFGGGCGDACGNRSIEVLYRATDDVNQILRYVENTDLPRGVWRHYCARMNITMSLPNNITEMRIYVNGSLKNSTTFSNTPMSWNGTFGINWGNNNDPSLSQNLTMDEVRLYRIALTDEQIANLSNLSLFVGTPEPVINITQNGMFTFRTQFDVVQGQTIPLCKNVVIPNCTIRLCYPS